MSAKCDDPTACRIQCRRLLHFYSRPVASFFATWLDTPPSLQRIDAAQFSRHFRSDFAMAMRTHKCIYVPVSVTLLCKVIHHGTGACAFCSPSHRPHFTPL